MSVAESSLAVSQTGLRERHLPPALAQLGVPLLLLPLMLFLLLFFLYPAVNLLSFSVLTQNSKGITGAPLTLAHYQRFFAVDLYMRVFWTTMRISAWTCVFAVLLGYPVAIVMVRSRPLIGRIISLIVIAPLIVSVVVRAYGWQLILTNGPNGPLNWVLLNLGLITAPLQILYTEAAVVIGQLHINLPMMVLPLASALGKIDPNLEDSARTLGAPWWRVFWRVTLPLSMPGLVAGLILVFSITAGAFVIPVILGGAQAIMLGNLIEQQIFTTFDWPFGATIAFILVIVVFALNALSMRLLEGRRFRSLPR